MLYDPKWSKAPSLDGFIAWLETKNPNKRYDWDNRAGNCAVGQYLRYCGIAWDSRPPMMYMDLACPGMTSFVLGNPRTFGAVLKRIRAWQAGLLR
jgi:hypothetical protein